MRRRIIRQGNNSFTMTLPVKWVRENSLEKEGEVDISEEGKKIIVSPISVSNIKESTISLKGIDEKSLSTTLTHLYRSGLSRITLKDVDKEKVDVIESLIDKVLTGMEISKKCDGLCILEVISEPRQENYILLLKKIFFIIQESVSIILENKELERIDRLTEKAKSHEQFCKRFIANNIKGQEGFEQYTLLSYLIVIQTDLQKMAGMISKEKIKISKRTEDDINKLLVIFKKVTEGFFEKDTKTLYDTDKFVRATLSANLNALSTIKEKPLYHFYLEILRILYSMHMPMIGLALAKSNSDVYNRT